MTTATTRSGSTSSTTPPTAPRGAPGGAGLRAKSVELTLANEGKTAIVYAVTRNDYEGSTKKVAVKGGSAKTVTWPVNQDGYYDVMVTASSGDGFRRRYAGRTA